MVADKSEYINCVVCLSGDPEAELKGDFEYQFSDVHIAVR